jgi:hypothetical protein
MPTPAKSSAAPAKKSATKEVSKAPAAKAPEAPKAPEPVKTAATKPAAAKVATAKAAALTPAERMKMIAEAAYYLAEKRGFSGGNELTDWVAAEKQVDVILARRG